jgi:hypothetical protein
MFFWPAGGVAVQFPASQESVNVLSYNISLDVNLITNPTLAQISVLQRERDNRHGKTRLFTVIDSQTDAVNCDRALLDKVRVQGRRDPKQEESKSSFLFYLLNHSDSIHMPRD